MQADSLPSEPPGKPFLWPWFIKQVPNITLWQIDGETLEILTDFIFLGSKIIAVVTATMKLKDACSLEEKL